MPEQSLESAPGPTLSRLRLGLVQFRPRKADPGENLRRVREIVRESAEGYDLLVFPETALSGYFLEGGVLEAALSVEEVAQGLGAPPNGGPDVLVGFYERWEGGFYNSAVYLEPTGDSYRPLHVHRKIFLPTYGLFQEGRFVDPGREVLAFPTRWGRMGVLVCEDLWHSLPATILALDGAEVLLVPSASPARDFGKGPGRPGNLERWDQLARGAAVEHGLFVAVAQLVGSEGGKMFPGGSVVVGPEGEILARGRLWEEEVVGAVLDGKALERARFRSPLLADLRQMLPHLERELHRVERGRWGRMGIPARRETGASTAVGGGRVGLGPARPGPSPGDTSFLELDLPLVRRALVEFIREEVGRRGFDGVVVGVSGGVDSAVALYLAVEALGPGAVTGFCLPYATSSPESLAHAALVLEATGAQARTIEITPAVEAYVREAEPDLSDMRRGNLAARLRGVVLFDQSAKLGRLPLGTGNKSERLLGYFTWHADDSPPINPLGDLFKTQVWALARYLGVPEVIVEKPASADLVRGVHDEDELGFSYHKADPILYWFLKGYRPEELVERGFEEDAVWAVWRRLNGTHWKRELPTVAVLSDTAIGEFYLRPVDYRPPSPWAP